MSTRTSNVAFGNAYSSVQANNINGSVHIGTGLDSTLARLPYAQDAPFNALTKQYEPLCLADTRVELLEEINSWADGQDSRSILWLRGLAGTGKSTIARTVARKYYNKRLAASFFFSRGGGDVGHAGKFVTSIAAQLADYVPGCRQHISDAVAERNDIALQALRDQWQHLILQPLLKLRQSEQELETYIIVVDALDECEGDNNVRMIVQLLAEARKVVGSSLRMLLTSRPEVPIRNGFRAMTDAEHRDFVLHDISPPVIDHDIAVYLEYTLRLVGQECDQTADWPGKEIVRRLTRNASGLFIWAATACRYIQQGGQFVANDRLQAILGDECFTSQPSPDNSSTEDSGTDDPSAKLPNRHLDAMYLMVLQGPVQKYRKTEKKKWYILVKKMLGAIVLLFSPLSASSLAMLLDVPVQKVHQTLSELHSILDVPQDHDKALRLHHPSFRDFLLDRGRCSEAFWVDEPQRHAALADYCIQVMSSSLKQDICGVEASGTLAARVDIAHLEQCLVAEVQYACVYWVQHLARSGTYLRDGGAVHAFLTKHCLHWIEALGWIGKVSEGIRAISSLESIIKRSLCPDLYAFVHDLGRFAMYSRSAIEQAPLQVYYSGLVFAPSGSIVKQRFISKIPQWIKKLPKVDSKWGATMQTLEGHSDQVRAVAFSPDGKVLASASYDETIKLWDLTTSRGVALQTLKGHSDQINTVAFSPDGKLLASASYDETVKLWDVSTGTGAAIRTIEGHSDWIRAIAFSPDSKVLALASYEIVRLCDVSAGSVTALQTLEGHSDQVNGVTFSPDGKVLASTSKDNTVKLWDVSTGTATALRTLKGHSEQVNEVAFSPNSKVVASASNDKTVKLWDTGTGAMIQLLRGHSDWVKAVAFSPDGKVIVSTSKDKTVKLWDAGTGGVMQTLKGHLDQVRTAAFLLDGKVIASASRDETVKLWNSGTGAIIQTLKSHSSQIVAVTFSPDGKVLASASKDKTVKLWDASTGQVVQTLKGHSDWVRAAVFSTDGKVLASASDDNMVKLWDAGTGETIHTLKGHSDWVRAVAFSPDGKRLASASSDGTVKLWDAGTGAEMQTYTLDTAARSLSFANDGVLFTDRGPICDTTCPTGTETQQNNSLGISVDQQWISNGSQRLLWLPPKYRGAVVAVCEDKVALGQRSGQVSLLVFALEYY